jgi:hypothetical protein
MTVPSNRLQRVLRKYAIDRRLALFAQAKAAQDRAALEATHAQLIGARDRQSATSGTSTGVELAQGSEWCSRLEGAASLLKPSLQVSHAAATEAAASAQLASGRVDRLERKIGEATRNEDRQRAMLLGSMIKRGKMAGGRSR